MGYAICVRNRGTLRGSALGDWLNAELELVWKPAVEVRQKEKIDPNSVKAEYRNGMLRLTAAIAKAAAAQKVEVKAA